MKNTLQSFIDADLSIFLTENMDINNNYNIAGNA